MPTGYTAGVQSGEITDFTEFAFTCAKAFGALISMRDEPHNAPIPEAFKPSTYNAERLAQTEARLIELRTMPIENCDEAAAAMFADQNNELKRRAASRIEEQKRYESMLSLVEAWQAPTPDHEGLKKFMSDQLSESIRFDCSDYKTEPPVRLSGVAWRESQIAKAECDVIYHRKENEKEIARTTSRNEWVKALRASLEAIKPKA